MLIFLAAFLPTLFSIFRSRAVLQLENLALRHQIGVLQRSVRKRPKVTPLDRLLWVWLFAIWSDWRWPRSEGCIIATNDGPPETLPSLIWVLTPHAGAIPYAREADTLPFSRQAKQSRTCKPSGALSAATLLHRFFTEIEFSIGTSANSARSQKLGVQPFERAARDPARSLRAFPAVRN
jgi:hypothetical protein